MIIDEGNTGFSGTVLESDWANVSGIGTLNIINHGTASSGAFPTAIYGEVSDPDGYPVYGNNTATSGNAVGVLGVSLASEGFGTGVWGASSAADGQGVYGKAVVDAPNLFGVYGDTPSTTGGVGVGGIAYATSGANAGIWGMSSSPYGAGAQGNAAADGGIGVLGRSQSPGATPIVAWASTSGAQTANLQEWWNSSAAALSVVNANGWLGVGTATPSYPLTVVTAVNASGSPTQTTAVDSAGRLTVVGGSPQMAALPPTGYDARMSMKRPSNAQTAAFEFDTGGQPYQWLFGNFYLTDFFKIDYWDGSKDNFWFNILQNGNVGIGTSTPAYRLDVAGQVHATGFPTSSDVRFKEDIHPIDNALEKVLRLKGVYFKWNHLHRETLKRSSGLTSRQVGLVAQQVREVVPELVSEWADEGAEDYLAVDYSRLNALTIEAIKQLNNKLEAENNTLRDRIEQQQQRIEALERRLVAS
jgi:hypothetical protein